MSQAVVVGVDFAGPREPGQQRRKILAVAARRVAPGRYVVGPDGFNARLVTPGPPGYTALELAEALTGPYPAQVVACDFPFSIPASLLLDPAFARRVGREEPFGTWQAFNRFVAERLPLTPKLELSAFAAWRDKAYWLKRGSDVPANAQPALKHMFQSVFNMTLVGNALLARLSTAGYRIDPFDADTGQPGVLVEIYPGMTMRQLGRRDYKQQPAAAIATVLAFCQAQGVVIDVDPQVRQRCETYGMTANGNDPDASDALIAACTGMLYREGLCRQILEKPDDARTAIEGALWAPVIAPKK